MPVNKWKKKYYFFMWKLISPLDPQNIYISIESLRNYIQWKKQMTGLRVLYYFKEIKSTVKSENSELKCQILSTTLCSFHMTHNRTEQFSHYNHHKRDEKTVWLGYVPIFTNYYKISIWYFHNVMASSMNTFLKREVLT